MATTPQPIVWEYYREIGDVDGTGTVLHYPDESCQSLYLKSGLRTMVSEAPEGHWKENEPGPEQVISNESYSMLDTDHAALGMVYGSAYHPQENTLYLLRYYYMKDISALVENGTWAMQIDNPISQLTMNVANINAEWFDTDVTFFQPGSKITLSFSFGDSKAYKIGTAWLDEVSYDALSGTVPISARNTIGFLLKDQTFDDEQDFAGAAMEIAKDILDIFGVTKYQVEGNETEVDYHFSPTTTGMSGLETMGSNLSEGAPPGQQWAMEEMADGTIIIGFDAFRARFLPKGHYIFHSGKELFKRKTSKRSDGAYTHVYVTGKDKNDNDLTPVSVEVDHWPFWNLGTHRTFHEELKDTTQTQLQAYAEALARTIQYVGISEAFEGPIRPHLLVGDIAAVYTDDDPVPTSLGIITEITHHFGKEGFYTAFTIDSGGDATESGDYVYTSAKSIHGDTRRKRITDIIKQLQNR